MNNPKLVVLWISLLLNPMLGTSLTKHFPNNFFAKKIAVIQKDLNQYLVAPQRKELLNSVDSKMFLPTYRTIGDGIWNNPAIWQGGVVPSKNLNGSIIFIDHEVISNGTLTIGNGTLYISGILTIPNDNLSINNSTGELIIDHGLCIITNGNFQLSVGTVNLIYGGIHLCNDNYLDESDGGTNGSGYIFISNGNIEDRINGNFSNNIAWCSPNGNGIGLPTSENCANAHPPGGCSDTDFYKTLDPNPPITNTSKIISGKVFRDANEDGLDNDGIGISGIPVYIYADTDLNGQVNTGDILLSSQVTDPNGQYSDTISNSISSLIATDDFTDATWDGTTWGGGTGWAGGWNDNYGESGGNLGPNLGTNGGNGWNVAIIDCNQTNNHNNCEPFGTPKISLENDDYISRPIDLSSYSSVDFSFDLETVPNNDNDDVITVKICTNTAETNCHTLFTNGFNNGNFAETPTTYTATLNDPTYLIPNAHLFFHIEGFSGSAEYVYLGGVNVTNNNSPTQMVITTDTNVVAVNDYYTTDNVETAIFAGINTLDQNNNFGISTGTKLENEIWLDLNANGIENVLEIGIQNMGICVSNASPILLEGVLLPAGNYMDTVYTDTNGIYVFNKLPDCDNWEITAHYDANQYTATYDADAGILNVTNFALNNGVVSSLDNAWCDSLDCIGDLDFGFSLAGDHDLSGTVCIDDGSKDGTCGTGGEEKLNSIDMLLYDEAGTFYGGLSTENDGSYLFPFLPEDVYIVSLNTQQMSLDTFLFTTKLGNTPATEILATGNNIFQKVPVQEDVFGVDYAFVPHSITQPVVAHDDVYNLCPGLAFSNWVGANDSTFSDTYFYSAISNSQNGTVLILSDGSFQYQADSYECGTDQFSYQLCDLLLGICDTATVTLIFTDNDPPILTKIPDDLTIHCDELLPDPALVSAYDNCPRIKLNLAEENDQGEDGCSQHNYTLTRTWLAQDLCGNTTSDFQTIEIKDEIAPDIFRIYTLANGKKLIAGIAEMTGERWKRVGFPIDFDTKPLVFTQMITYADADPAIVQTRNISPTQFELHLAEAEQNATIHGRESVAWLAIESGTQIEDYQIIAGTELVNDYNKEITFPNAFSAIPAFFTAIQTTDESDPAIISYQDLGTDKVKLKLVEETSKDQEMMHIDEEIAYLGIEHIGDLTNKRGEIFGEVDTIKISDMWTTVTLNHSYHNPIIIVSGANNVANSPATFRVNNVQSNSFDLQIQELDNQNFPSRNEVISYLVVEGSIPLYSLEFCDYGTDSLVIGQDILAIDNCDNSVDLTYKESKHFNGAVQVIDRTWRSIDECGNAVDYTQQITCEGVGVKIQTFLQGALIGSEKEDWMRDDLRRKGLIPRVEPYTDLLGFKHYGKGGGEQLDTSLLEVLGKDAIVDWVLLEIRNKNDVEEVIATSAGLVQRDGDVISATGDTIIVFENVPFDNYYLAIRHRNHIGMTTKDTYQFGLNAVPELDFRDIFTPTEGNRPGIKSGNKNAQWSGDINGDGKTIYQGPNNDPFEMFLAVILDKSNEEFLVNYINQGYTQKDFNLDGTVIYQGPNNDRSNLLFHTILAHPDNKQFLANFIVVVDPQIAEESEDGN